MNIRFLCVVSLFCFALTAHAVDLYEFDGYFVSKKEGSDPAAQIPDDLVGGKFSGWIVYDGDRKFNRDMDTRYAAPLVSVYIETESGYTISSTNNDGNIRFDIGSQETPPSPTERIVYGVDALSDGFIYLGGSPFHGSINFLWASTESGQVPEVDLETSSADPLAPVHFRPNSWTLQVSVTPRCPNPPRCDPYKVSTLKGHITRFGPRKSQHFEPFNAAPADWTASGGAWAVENGYYRNVANVAFTHSVYNGLETTGEYDLSVVMASQWGAPGNRLGLLLHYRDSANFDELRLNALGAATYTRVTRGVRTVLRTGQYAAEGPGGAFNVSVFRRGSSLRVRAGAFDVFTVDVGMASGGRVGLFASWNQARFHQLNLFVQHLWTVSHSDFGTSTAGWTPVAGAWTAVDGYFHSSSNLTAAIATSAPIEKSEYTIDTSMLLEWSNTGNQGGLIYDYVNPSNYRAVLIACGGCAVGVGAGPLHVVEVVNGVRRVVLSSTAGPRLLPRQWTTVGVRRIGDLTEIIVQEVPIRLKQPVVPGAKRAGLIARFNRVRFDDVVVGVPP